MDINPVIVGSNKYCGPAVLSSLLKIDTGEAARRIRVRTGKRSVKGTYLRDLLAVLIEAGFDLKPTSYLRDCKGKNPTLAGWLKLSKESRVAGRVFLISAGRHWQLVSGRRYVCGLTKEIVSVRDKRVRRRSRVNGVYEVTKG